MIVATNHSVFERPRGAGGHRRPRQSRLPSRGPWNALGAAQVFAYANEIAALRA